MITNNTTIMDEENAFKAYYGLNKLKAMKTAEQLKNDNPYPVEVFHEPTAKELKKVVKCLKDNGFSPDALFGYWGRTVWNNCVERLKELSEDAPVEISRTEAQIMAHQIWLKIPSYSWPAFENGFMSCFDQVKAVLKPNPNDLNKETDSKADLTTGWIQVSDRLPEKINDIGIKYQIDVWVDEKRWPHRIIDCFYTGQHFYKADRGAWDKIDKVTHWMYRPEPPKEEK